MVLSVVNRFFPVFATDIVLKITFRKNEKKPQKV